MSPTNLHPLPAGPVTLVGAALIPFRAADESEPLSPVPQQQRGQVHLQLDRLVRDSPSRRSPTSLLASQHQPFEGQKTPKGLGAASPSNSDTLKVFLPLGALMSRTSASTVSRPAALATSSPTASSSNPLSPVAPTSPQMARFHDLLDSGANELQRSTTLMLQNLCYRYTQDTLLQDLTTAGFGAGRIDFLYLPFHFGQRMCQGYAFVNFSDPLTAGAFAGSCGTRPFGRYGSQVRVTLAERQGKTANVEGLRRSIMKINNPRYMPLVLEGEGNAAVLVPMACEGSPRV